MESKGAENISSTISAVKRVTSEMSLLMPQLDARRVGTELYGATEFSVLEVIEPNENTLSKIIVELFNPSGSHGQGPLFLNTLLSTIGLAQVNLRESFRSRREVLTRNRRRIDVVIETNQFVIGIENKPWAAQQPNPLQDYLEELSSDLQGRQPVLIFLSDQQEQSAKGQVIKVPYFTEDDSASLHQIIVKAHKKIKATKPRDLVGEFIDYIERHFGGTMPDKEADTIYVEAIQSEFSNPNNRKAVASFMLASSRIQYFIINEIAEFLAQEIRNYSPTLSEVVHSRQNDLATCLKAKWVPWGIRRPSWPANCEVALESLRGSFKEIILGVRAPDPEQAEPELRSVAHQHLNDLPMELGGGRNSTYWPWFQTWDVSLEAESVARLILRSPSGLVKDHPDVQELAKKVRELALAVDRRVS